MITYSRNGHKIHFGQLKGGQAGDFSSRFAEQVWAQPSLLTQTQQLDNQASELEMERRQLPMWGARESFLKEVVYIFLLSNLHQELQHILTHALILYVFLDSTLDWLNIHMTHKETSFSYVMI